MATTAEAIRALAILSQAGQIGKGGPKGGFTVKQLQRWGASLPSAAGAKGDEQGTLGSIGSAFKNFGTTAMNVLSVPQAMLFTAGSKTIDALTGGKMKSTMGWDEMLGGFSPNYHGYKEIIQQVGEPMGLSKDSALGTWGGLAGDIALDPLWFVAPAKLARVPGQAVKAGETIASLANATSKTVDAARLAKGVSKDAGTVAMLGRVAKTPAEKYQEAVRLAGQVSPDAGTMALLKKFAASTPKPPTEFLPTHIGDASKALKSEKVTLRVEGGGVGISDAAQQLGTTRGTKIGDFFIHEVAPRSRKKDGPPAKVRIYRLAQPNRLHSEDQMISVPFTTKTAAEKWLRNRIDEVGGDFNKVEPKLTNLGPSGTPNLHEVGRAFDAHRANIVEQFAGHKNQLGIKLGVGKVNPEGGRGLTGANYTFRTNVPLKAAPSLGSVAGLDKLSGTIKRTPFAKAVNQMSRAAREMKEAARTEQTITARAMYGLSDEESKLVTFAAALDNVSHPGLEGEVLLGSEMFATQLRRAGNWTPEMDKALKYAQGRMGAFREMHGISEKTYRKLSPGATKFERSVQKFVEDSLKAGIESDVIDRQMTKMIRDAVKARTISKTEARQILGTKKALQSTRGPYLRQMLDAESKAAKQDDALRMFIGSKTGAGGARDVARKHESLLNFYTSKQFNDELRAAGIDPFTANNLTKTLDKELKRLETDVYKGKEGMVAFSTEEIASKPETDLFKILGESDSRAINKELLHGIDQLAIQAGFAHPGKNGKLIFTSKKHERAYMDATKSLQAGALASNRGWQKYVKWVSGVKMFITSAQPTHYFGNATGDYFKALVHGNIRHWVPPTAAFMLTGTLGGKATKGSRIAKLVTGDAKVMDEPFMEIAGHTYSGAEVLWMTHMIGLGKGFAGAEIAELRHIFDKADGLFGIRHLKQYGRWMARQNHTREDAVRVQTWIRHIESGDDPMTAGMKTIRDHFDYNDMTDFEKNVLRNVILFYTWSRKNIPFQVSAMGAKPGLYSAYGDIERDRPKMANEPGYIGALGLLPIPGLGSFNVSAPWADLNKIPTSPDGLKESVRTNIFGAAAPGLKQAIELSLDKNLLTGGPAEKSGERALFGQSWLDYWARQYNPVVTQAVRAGKNGTDLNGLLSTFGNITGVARKVNEDPNWAEMMKARQKAGG